MGSSRRELVRTTSASAAAIGTLAAAPSAARAADHSAATSPMLGDFDMKAILDVEIGLARATTFPIEPVKIVRAVKNLLFTSSLTAMGNLDFGILSVAV